MRDSICERNDELNDNLNVNDNAGAIFNEYDDVLPPQIQQNAPKPPQAPVMPMQPPVQPPIIGQTLIPPVMGASANSYISAANQVPFLFHNQQIRQ
ncbi:hypothetical protein TRFO_07342 [Tritrichomonas foetus]|uniref:Uncharacterized protein n=1 Tax=Tritrichomonas foetus TaxID=1144522 RepID=A0A1J4JRY3_9EUKA|nr:hypothetical protein TRFO_07342 [Tritrichomonas foetus]|eukprot:OHT01795.1 hypothetical protein TRFO_07342 [Tritrichomonas foetus]